MIRFLRKIIDSLKKQRQTTYGAGKNSSLDYTGYHNKDGSFAESFYENLRKTINWTQKIVDAIQDPAHIDYLRIFRSVNPVYEGKPFYRFNDDALTASVPNIPFNYNTIISEALMVRLDKTLPLINISNLGKILRFEIDKTTYDGAPAAELGFVDEADIPPIDTWFYITKRYLYCWIPTLFVDKMQDAIDAEILDSYAWLEDLDPTLNREIEEKMQR